MLYKVNTFAVAGLEILEVVAEVNISSRGIPTFDIVGLPSKSVCESRYRVKAAFQNSGIEFPDKKITVNLSPADVIKEGSLYDLPIATAILCHALGVKPPAKSIFMGELSMDGSCKYSKGGFRYRLKTLQQQ